MHSNDRYEVASETLLNESSLNDMYAEEQRLNNAFDAIDFDRG